MAPTPLNLQGYNDALKELYTEDYITDLTYCACPLWAMMQKEESFVGSDLRLVNLVSQPQGVSSDFAVAQEAQNGVDVEAFRLTRTRWYGVASITGETAMASKIDAGAFMDGTTAQIDGILAATSRQLCIDMPRNGGGAIGRIATNPVGTPTITLADINEIVNFERGMQVETASTDGTTGVVKLGFGTISAINRTTGVLTLDANWDARVPTVATNDFVFRRGMFGAAVAGLSAWVPQVAPLPGDNFFGLDRSSDVTRLAGQRFDGTGLTIQEALVGGQSIAARECGKIDYFFVNNVQYRNLVNELGAKVVYDRAVAFKAAHIGFRTIVIDGDMGPIQVIADNTIPTNVAFGLEMKTWKFHSIGPAVQILKMDDNQILRQSAADSYEVRCGGYGNLATSAAGHNVRVTLS